VGWIIFTAIDLYIGLIVIKSMQPTLPPAKKRRAAVVVKIILVLLSLCVVAFALRLWRRP
jgi:hypothetical protein